MNLFFSRKISFPPWLAWLSLAPSTSSVLGRVSLPLPKPDVFPINDNTDIVG